MSLQYEIQPASECVYIFVFIPVAQQFTSVEYHTKDIF